MLRTFAFSEMEVFMSILVTGGAGYIGSHCVQRLLRDGHQVVALDNLYRGHAEAVALLETVAGKNGGGGGSLRFVRGDIADRALVKSLVVEHTVETVIHFAALAYVGESVTQPLNYYRNNTAGSIAMLEAIDEAGKSGQEVSRLVFSSTCATYGEPPEDQIPIRETCPQSPINPYGWSKLFFERVLKDYAEARRREQRPFSYAALRYFNVAGCDRTGLLGEHHEPETHLIPVALQAVMGTRGPLTVFGTDYPSPPSPDGTCVRDYVHVEDLVDAHVTVMKALNPSAGTDERFYNLGTGQGLSVRQIIDSVERVTGKPVPRSDGPRRAGDPPTLFADPAKIRRELGWSAAIREVDEIVGSAWKWFRDHPKGYKA